MSAILIDNWNLSNIKLQRSANNEWLPNKAYSDLLSTLILWDDVYYYDDGFGTIGWKYRNEGSGLNNALKPIHLVEEEKNRLIKYSEEKNIFFAGKIKPIISERAFFYEALGRNLGIDYYPVEERAEFLENYNLKQDIINRKNLDTKHLVIQKLDNMYTQQLKQLGLIDLYIDIPLLADYVVYNSNSPETYVKTAIDIKNDSKVRRFRKYLESIDQQVEKGNSKELNNVLREISELVNQIYCLEKKKIKISGNVKLKILPTMLAQIIALENMKDILSEELLISLGILSLGTTLLNNVEANLDIELFFKTNKRKWQLTFLRKVFLGKRKRI